MTSMTVRSLPTPANVRPGEGRENRKSDARAQRQQSTFPVGACRPMLTYSLTGTTEDSGFDRNDHSHRPPERGLSPDHTQSLTDTESREPRPASEEARQC